MGHARIILRPTSFSRKAAGQFRKLFGLWGNSKKITDVGTKINPKLEMTDGRPTFLQRNSGFDQRFITRRQVVLNRHFTEILSESLANSIKMQLSDIGVSITSIETRAWDRGIQIFYTTDNPFDAQLHKKLNSLVPQLRLAIAEQMRLGKVPLVNFVYDETERLHQDLELILGEVEKVDDEVETSLLKTESNDLQPTRANKENGEFNFTAKGFSAPEGMSNTVLGLDYPSLYNEISVKLERGRGQSERMTQGDSITTTSPVFRLPIGETEVENPATRLLNMQKFLVRQRKKNEYLSKIRRKQELLHRDQYKWDVPEESTTPQEEAIEEQEEARDDYV